MDSAPFPIGYLATRKGGCYVRGIAVNATLRDDP